MIVNEDTIESMQNALDRSENFDSDDREDLLMKTFLNHTPNGAVTRRMLEDFNLEAVGIESMTDFVGNDLLNGTSDSGRANNLGFAFDIRLRVRPIGFNEQTTTTVEPSTTPTNMPTTSTDKSSDRLAIGAQTIIGLATDRNAQKELLNYTTSGNQPVDLNDGFRLSVDGKNVIALRKNSKSGEYSKFGIFSPNPNGGFNFKLTGSIYPDGVDRENALGKHRDLWGGKFPDGLTWDTGKLIYNADGYTSAGEWLNSFSSYTAVDDWAEPEFKKSGPVRYFSDDHTVVVPFYLSKSSSYGYVAWRDGEIVGYSVTGWPDFGGRRWGANQKIDTQLPAGTEPTDNLDPYSQNLPDNPVMSSTTVSVLAGLLGFTYMTRLQKGEI
jgi:hypothetical protein